MCFSTLDLSQKARKQWPCALVIKLSLVGDRTTRHLSCHIAHLVETSANLPSITHAWHVTACLQHLLQFQVEHVCAFVQQSMVREGYWQGCTVSGSLPPVSSGLWWEELKANLWKDAELQGFLQDSILWPFWHIYDNQVPNDDANSIHNGSFLDGFFVCLEPSLNT